MKIKNVLFLILLVVKSNFLLAQSDLKILGFNSMVFYDLNNQSSLFFLMNKPSIADSIFLKYGSEVNSSDVHLIKGNFVKEGEGYKMILEGYGETILRNLVVDMFISVPLEIIDNSRYLTLILKDKSGNFSNIEYFGLNGNLDINKGRNQNSKFKIYPNNTSNKDINISFFLESPSAVLIELLDVSGKVLRIIEKSFKESGPNNKIFNISEIKPGNYYVRLKVKDQSFSEILIVN